ncbi:hypothetical protein BC936DRAFT_144219 [Jimgerdemannia flammicorona]|uniref:CHCH domain-containing protein n=1 Tax=Jimgerdemannia flammicorona TaxID=994334 RepID=A0A433DCV4_9FUNG|nr:hypothetical protein BC936DRAFT_144219 [Jimgerdemannia flammicorona]
MTKSRPVPLPSSGDVRHDDHQPLFSPAMSSPQTAPALADPIEDKPTLGLAGGDIDEYNDRIRRTGCFEENEALQLCFYDRKDWRACGAEMKRFRECWKKHEKANGQQE